MEQCDDEKGGSVSFAATGRKLASKHYKTRMWVNVQRDGRPAEYKWHPLLNAARFGCRPLLECRPVTLPI